MKYSKTFFLMTVVVALLCGCSKKETPVDNDYWRGKLKNPAAEEGIIEEAQTAAQDMIEEGKDASSSLYELTGSQEENSFFAGIGQSIGKLLKQWGKEGKEEAEKENVTSSRAEDPIYTTTILEDALNTENGRVKVGFDRVVDGDTIMVTYKEWLLRVRLIGINAPESVHKDDSKNTEEGLAASNFLKEFLSETSSLWLEFDQDPEDDYGRALAYVWLTAEGKLIEEDLLNGVILSNGFAEVMTVEPNRKYAEAFEKINP